MQTGRAVASFKSIKVDSGGIMLVVLYFSLRIVPIMSKHVKKKMYICTLRYSKTRSREQADHQSKPAQNNAPETPLKALSRRQRVNA